MILKALKLKSSQYPLKSMQLSRRIQFMKSCTMPNKPNQKYQRLSIVKFDRPTKKTFKISGKMKSVTISRPSHLYL